jgi:DNA-directed RNA polymerase subunit RPC12/RpoP
MMNDNMRTCVTETGREIDIEKEKDWWKAEPTNNNNSIETKESVTDTYMRTPLMKNISDKNGRIAVWLGKELKTAGIEAGINFSSFFRSKLSEELKNRNIEVKTPEPDLIIEARCPHCWFSQETTTLKYVRCKNCGKNYRIFNKGTPSRIVRIVKGNQRMLNKKYYKIFRRR